MDAGAGANGRKGKNEGKKGIALAKATQINENKEGVLQTRKGLILHQFWRKCWLVLN